MKVEPGFDEAERGRVATLYWQAFGDKLGRALGPEPKALRFLIRVLRPAHALVVRSDLGEIIGVAGFKTHEGALAEGGAWDLVMIYGPLGAVWRLLLLALVERDADNARFLIDGIFVASEARGQGAGSALIEALGREALMRGHTDLRLDVMETNGRARALYERRGFTLSHRHRPGLGGRVLGYGATLAMVRRLR